MVKVDTTNLSTRVRFRIGENFFVFNNIDKKCGFDGFYVLKILKKLSF